MAFENKTIQEVYNTFITGLESELNTQFRLLPKAFVHVLAKVMAGVYITLYKLCGWIFLQIFPETASYGTVDVLGKKINPLVEWGNLIGCGEPNEATTFSAQCRVAVLNDGVITAGTQLKSAITGKVYLVNESVTVLLSEGESVLISVDCAENGTAGNLEAGDELKFVSPLGFIGDVATVETVDVEAVDAEDVEVYRHRVVNRWKTQPQGGSLSDYRIWASDVEGVYQTYIYSDDNSPAGVIIFVCADEVSTGSRIADNALCKAVGEACTYDPETGEQNRKPVTAVLDPAYDGSYANVKTITEVMFDVYITGYTGDVSVMSENAKTAIQNYMKEREPYIRGLSVDNNRVDSISVNNLIGLVNEIATANTASFDGVNLMKSSEMIAEYTLDRGELAKLNNLYINGVAV